MNKEEIDNLNRKLKGAHLNILIALNNSEKSLTAVELQEKTNWSDKPVRRDLDELEAMGFVEHHGRMQGWTITAKWQAVLLALSVTSKTTKCAEQAKSNGGINTQKGSNPKSTSGRNSESKSENLQIGDSDQIWPESDLNEDINKDQSGLVRSDQVLIRPDLKQASRENGECRPVDGRTTMEQEKNKKNRRGEQEALEFYLKRIGIENPAYDEILARDRLVDVVAWHWAIQGETWMNNPRGWMITCLKNGDKPAKGFCEFAELWLTMSKKNYDDYLAVRDQPVDLEFYWREWDLSPEETEVLNRVTRHGGLELFEDFERPILSAESGARNGE
jgi:hypothetical protein